MIKSFSPLALCIPFLFSCAGSASDAAPSTDDQAIATLFSSVAPTVEVGVSYNGAVLKGAQAETIQFSFPAGVNFEGKPAFVGVANTANLSDSESLNPQDLKAAYKFNTFTWTGNAYSYLPQIPSETTSIFAWKIGNTVYRTPLIHIHIFDAVSAPNDNSALGVNLSSVDYWSTEIVFTNVARQMGTWLTATVNDGSWDTGVLKDVPLDANGYPLEIPTITGKGPTLVHTLLLREIGTHYPAGDYICLYDGDGDIDFMFAGKVTAKQLSPNLKDNRIVVHVTPDDAGIDLRIVLSKKENPVHNVRLILPGYENSYKAQPFYSKFLQDTQKYKVLRFMNMQNTNGNNSGLWQDRTKPTAYTQSQQTGVAVEHMVAIANALHADPWFCMPHKATDDYVNQFATLVKNQLDPSLKIYIEYSNEVWNTMFAQSSYAMQQGQAQNPPLGGGNQYLAGYQYTALRSVQIFKIWEGVFGSAERFVRVLPSQTANLGVSTAVMDFVVNGKPASQQADALAVAPYFGVTPDPAQAPGVISQGLAGLFNTIETVAIPQVTGWFQSTSAAAAQRGLPMIGYEGGQHLVGVLGAENNNALTNLFLQANGDAKMGDEYKKLLNNWKAAGGTMLVLFNSNQEWSKWGSWGAKQYQDQGVLDSPKYKAVIDFINQTPVWW